MNDEDLVNEFVRRFEKETQRNIISGKDIDMAYIKAVFKVMRDFRKVATEAAKIVAKKHDKRPMHIIGFCARKPEKRS